SPARRPRPGRGLCCIAHHKTFRARTARLTAHPGPRETAANCPKLPTLFSDDFLRPYKSASYETSKKEGFWREKLGISFSFKWL
ncbi:TPA: hypothetical protein ACUUEK_005381, partial [Pseudomonas aeruginosa]